VYALYQAARHRMSKALINAAQLFYRTSNLLHRAADAYKRYTTGSAVGSTRGPAAQHSPTPPLIFTGSQKVCNLASIFDSSLSCLCFETKQLRIGTISSLFGAAMMELCSPQI